MKQQKHIDEANAIGLDSWGVNAFTGLPSSASSTVQVSALRRDQGWLRDHMEAVSRRIDGLIADIESDKIHKEKDDE